MSAVCVPGSDPSLPCTPVLLFIYQLQPVHSLSTKKHQIICESKWHCWHTMHSGPQLTAIVCPTIGPNTLQPMPYQLCSTGAPLETIHKANVTVDGSWKKHESAVKKQHWLLSTGVHLQMSSMSCFANADGRVVKTLVSALSMESWGFWPKISMMAYFMSL